MRDDNFSYRRMKLGKRRVSQVAVQHEKGDGVEADYSVYILWSDHLISVERYNYVDNFSYHKTGDRQIGSEILIAPDLVPDDVKEKLRKKAEKGE